MVMNMALIEWFGFAASVVVAISLTMSSIVKLRWFNLAGAAMFSVYGFIIGALPVALLNLFICGINVMYLRRMYRERDDFRIMALSGDSEYFDYFLQCHRAEIAKFFPHFDPAQREGRNTYYLVKNSVPIGLLIGRAEGHALAIELDYVAAPYRDFKMGSFLYGGSDYFQRQGFSTLKARAGSGKSNDYWSRMGFVREGDFYIRTL